MTILKSEDLKELRSADVKIGDLELKIGITHGLGEARKLLEEVRAGKSAYHAIEIMACKGGCIDGGGHSLTITGNTAILKKANRGSQN